MKLTTIVLILGLFGANAFAAEKVSLRDKSKNEIAQMSLGKNSLGLMSLQMSRISTDNYLLVSEQSKEGAEYLRFQQYYQQVPVQGYEAALKMKNGKVQRVAGFRLENIANDVKSIEAKIDSKIAIRKAKSEYIQREKIKKGWVYKDIIAEKVIYADSNEKAHLAYSVSFFADTKVAGNPRKPLLVVDANTGALLAYHNNLHFSDAEATGPGGNEKVGKINYGTDYPALKVSTKDKVTCSLENANVRTIDLNHSSSRSGGNALSFPCGENTKKEINGAYSPLNDAHAFGATVFSMYKEWYGNAPLKGKLQLRVHYGNQFENAFWDGKSMTFGDGKNRFYPLVSLDVMAHEVSHGFTQFNSNLAYKGQSGGINEAFSDMAGEAAEFFREGKNDFLVGSSIFKGEGALRYMANPPKDGKSLDHVSNFKWSGICDIFPVPDQCTDVHHSSGIYNKVFYTLATAKGWDTKKAFDLFYHANTSYWTANTNFVEGAKGVLDAAEDLGYPKDIVKKAFASVGINI